VTWYLAHLAAFALMPFVLVGVLNRTKALWSGRKGPPILQSGWDVLRLFRKSVVYSEVTTPIFQLAPLVGLVTAGAAALVVPIFGSASLLGFQLDFVWMAYLWGLGRVALVLAAFDTGSSFEGMGAARAATFSTLVEPTLFLTLGTLTLVTGKLSLHEVLAIPLADSAAVAVWALSVVALLIVLQVEASRMPVDDPTTHLELTMIHEVMVLDHSGPDLALIQLAAGLKFFVGSAMIATLLNPGRGTSGWLTGAFNLALCVLIAVGVGTVESLIARLKLRAVPQYVAVAMASAAVALLATAWRAVGAP